MCNLVSETNLSSTQRIKQSQREGECAIPCLLSLGSVGSISTRQQTLNFTDIPSQEGILCTFAGGGVPLVNIVWRYILVCSVEG